jgi:hypothetical protein
MGLPGRAEMTLMIKKMNTYSQGSFTLNVIASTFFLPARGARHFVVDAVHTFWRIAD